MMGECVPRVRPRCLSTSVRRPSPQVFGPGTRFPGQEKRDLAKQDVLPRNVSELNKTASREPVRRMQAKTSHKRWEQLRDIVSRAPLGGAIASAATTGRHSCLNALHVF